jgi:DNA-binding transcriptional ArsR family regulator
MVYRSDPLDAAFGALADGTRRAILAQLASGERTISEIARNFSITLPAVSKHVRVLERAGLAVVRQEGRVRRCGLVATPLRDAAGWIDRYRRFWEASFDRLADYLDETLTEEDPAWPAPPPRRRRTPSPSSSAASSPRRGNASSPHGRRPKP